MADPEPDSTQPIVAARMPASGGEPSVHPRWCQYEVPAEFGGTEHVSGLQHWRPAYQHEVALLGWMRQVAYPDGGHETPAVVVRIDNPDQPGEIAMTAADLAACAERLLQLRDAVLDERVPPPRSRHR